MGMGAGGAAAGRYPDPMVPAGLPARRHLSNEYVMEKD